MKTKQLVWIEVPVMPHIDQKHCWYAIGLDRKYTIQRESGSGYYQLKWHEQHVGSFVTIEKAKELAQAQHESYHQWMLALALKEIDQ